jgi:hypothetical protein
MDGTDNCFTMINNKMIPYITVKLLRMVIILTSEIQYNSKDLKNTFKSVTISSAF